jgi:hypothetical protein
MIWTICPLPESALSRSVALNLNFAILNMFPYAPHLAFWLAHYGGMAFGVFRGKHGRWQGDGNRRPTPLSAQNQTRGYQWHADVRLPRLASSRSRRCTLRKSSSNRTRGEKVPEGMRRKLRSLARELGAGDIEVISTYGFTEAKMAWGECSFPHDQPSGGIIFTPISASWK